METKSKAKDKDAAEPAQPVRRESRGPNAGDKVHVFIDYDAVAKTDVAPAVVTRVHGAHPSNGGYMVDLHVNPDAGEVTARTSVHLFETKEQARLNRGNSAFVQEADPAP